MWADSPGGWWWLPVPCGHSFGASQCTWFSVFGQTRRGDSSGLHLTGVQEETVWEWVSSKKNLLNTASCGAQLSRWITVGCFCSVITRDPYVIAVRSVSLTSHPPAEGCNRGEVRCAGFTIHDTKNNTSLVKPTITLLKIHSLLIFLWWLCFSFYKKVPFLISVCRL